MKLLHCGFEFLRTLTGFRGQDPRCEHHLEPENISSIPQHPNLAINAPMKIFLILDLDVSPIQALEFGCWGSSSV